MVVLSSFPLPTEGIRLEQRNTGVYVNNVNLGKGTLYIAESCLTWIGSAENGFSIEYPHISLHAISRDLNAFPEECLFLMLDVAIDDFQEPNEDSDNEITTELRFVPEDRGMLDAMFHAMSACQALHPDPEDSFSDEDFYEDADEGEPVNEANSQMANLCIEENSVSLEDGMEVDTAAGRVGGRVVGRTVGREGGMGEDTGVGNGVGTVAGREVGNGVDTAEDRGVGRVAGMVVGTAEDMAADRSQLLSEYRNSYSSHTDQAENCSDTGWFDDA